MLSPEAQALDFQRATLRDIHADIKRFAKDKDVVYISPDLREDPDTLRIEESAGNFDLVRKHIEETVEVLNKMLKSHNKPFAFEVDDRGKVILVRACPLER